MGYLWRVCGGLSSTDMRILMQDCQRCRLGVYLHRSPVCLTADEVHDEQVTAGAEPTGLLHAHQLVRVHIDDQGYLAHPCGIVTDGAAREPLVPVVVQKEPVPAY